MPVPRVLTVANKLLCSVSGRGWCVGFWLVLRRARESSLHARCHLRQSIRAHNTVVISALSNYGCPRLPSSFTSNVGFGPKKEALSGQRDCGLRNKACSPSRLRLTTGTGPTICPGLNVGKAHRPETSGCLRWIRMLVTARYSTSLYHQSHFSCSRPTSIVLLLGAIDGSRHCTCVAFVHATKVPGLTP